MEDKEIKWSSITLMITMLWTKIKANFSNTIEKIFVNGKRVPTGPGKAIHLLIPEEKTKLSQLTNDTAFITKTVSDLANYYKKTETYTRKEINDKISAIPKFEIKVVSKLPTSDISKTTIYLVRASTTGTENLFTEYIRISEGGKDKWEKLGEQKLDLSGYLTKVAADKAYAKIEGDDKRSFAAKGIIFDIPLGIGIGITSQRNFYFTDNDDRKTAQIDLDRVGDGETAHIAFLSDLPKKGALVSSKDMQDLIDSLK